MTGTAASLLAFLAAVLALAGAGLLVPERLSARSDRRWLPRLAGPGWHAGSRAIRALAAAGARAGLAARARAPRDLPARIEAAGRPAGLGPREVMGAKLAGAMAGGAGGVLLGAILPGRLGLATTLAGPVAGFMAPDAWLARLANERFRRVREELPAMLDLLRVTVEAGPSLTAALLAVGERKSGPLAAEWRAVGRQVVLGTPIRAALAEMTQRLPIPEVEAMVGALDRAMRHGAPLADTLAAQAHDARLARRRHIQEEAARAAPKIQLVVALLLVPSVLLLIAAALAAALLDSGGALPLA